MTGYKSKRAAAQDKLQNKPPVQWPFPTKLLPAKPVGKLPFNPNNYEDALL
jgi:hypothetical protein